MRIGTRQDHNYVHTCRIDKYSLSGFPNLLERSHGVPGPKKKKKKRRPGGLLRCYLQRQMAHKTTRSCGFDQGYGDALALFRSLQSCCNRHITPYRRDFDDTFDPIYHLLTALRG